MSLWYEMTLPIDSRDVDGKGVCKASALLGHLQEAATQAAEHGGFSREVITREHGAFWMLTRVWYQLRRPLRWEEPLTIRTWHRGARGASTYRDFDLYVEGKLVGEAVSTWVLADADTHRIFRMSRVDEFQGTDGGELCKSRTLSGLHLPAHMEHVESRALHYSDTDVNGHVNNVRYVDFICDALHMENLGPGRYVSSLQVGYLAECRAGETIELCAGQEDGIWYVHGADPAGKSRFDGAVELSHITP